MKAKLILLAAALMFSAVPALAVHEDTINLTLPGVNTVEHVEVYFLHRFLGNAGDQPLMNALGTDLGANATMGLGVRLRDNMDVTILRSSLSKEYLVACKIKIKDGVSLVLGGTDKSDPSITHGQYSYLAELVLERELVNDRLAVSLVPTVSNPLPENPTVALGATAGLAFDSPYGYLEKTELILECVPVLSGYALKYAAAAAGIKFQTGGHFFTLLFSNNFQPLPDNNILGSSDNVWHFGFNITRKF